MFSPNFDGGIVVDECNSKVTGGVEREREYDKPKASLDIIMYNIQEELNLLVTFLLPIKARICDQFISKGIHAITLRKTAFRDSGNDIVSA